MADPSDALIPSPSTGLVGPDGPGDGPIVLGNNVSASPAGPGSAVTLGSNVTIPPVDPNDPARIAISTAFISATAQRVARTVPPALLLGGSALLARNLFPSAGAFSLILATLFVAFVILAFLPSACRAGIVPGFLGACVPPTPSEDASKLKAALRVKYAAQQKSLAAQNEIALNLALNAYLGQQAPAKTASNFEAKLFRKYVNHMD